MFKTILVAVDLSDNSEFIVAKSAELASVHGAALKLIHVDPLQVGDLQYDPGSEEERDRISHKPGGEDYSLEQLCSLAAEKGAKDPSYLTADGNPTDEILKAAQEHSADLLVLGSHGHGKLYHLLAGSTRESILTKVHLPVLVLRKPS